MRSMLVAILSAALALAAVASLPADAACVAQSGDSVVYKTASGLRHCPDGETWTDVPIAPAIPAGAIMAFDLTSCPPGWSEYTAARGRFLRGIDSSGSTAVDSAGTRAPGNLQEGSLVMNNGGGAADMRVFSLYSPSIAGMNYDRGTGNAPGFAGEWRSYGTGDKGVWGSGSYDSNYVGIARPRNVAVLYCRKS